MTKLQEEMFFAIHGFSLPSDPELANQEINDCLKAEARAAAEVAKKYIEKAFTFATYLGAAHNTSLNPEAYETEMIKWLRENGITE